MRRGQSAIEFVILTSVMLLLFTIIVIGVEKTLVDATADTKQRTVQELQQAVERELLLAEQMPPGYGRTFTLPDSIQGIPYTIAVRSEAEPLRDELVVTLRGESTISYLLQNVSGTLRPGENTLTRQEGVIMLN